MKGIKFQAEGQAAEVEIAERKTLGLHFKVLDEGMEP